MNIAAPNMKRRCRCQQRATEKAKNDLLEKLKAQEKLEESQLLEQNTARESGSTHGTFAPGSESTWERSSSYQQGQGNMCNW